MLTAGTITDEQILAEYSHELGVWSVGITLPDGTYVGFGCATEAEVPLAKADVRARCAELLEAALVEKEAQEEWQCGDCGTIGNHHCLGVPGGFPDDEKETE
jgi:hypothetical protein